MLLGCLNKTAGQKKRKMKKGKTKTHGEHKN